MTSEEYRKKLKRPERDVQNAICEYLKLCGVPFSITDATAVLNLRGKRVASKARRGWPDITAVLPEGRALFIECKSTIGRVRPEQKAMHDILEAQGAIVIVARSLDDVQSVFRDMGIEHCTRSGRLGA